MDNISMGFSVTLLEPKEDAKEYALTQGHKIPPHIVVAISVPTGDVLAMDFAYSQDGAESLADSMHKEIHNLYASLPWNEQTPRGLQKAMQIAGTFMHIKEGQNRKGKQGA